MNNQKLGKFAQELSDMNVGNEHIFSHPSSEIKEVNEIPGTPFSMVKLDDKYFLAFGKHRLSPILESKDDVEKYVEQNAWHITTIICGIVAEAAVKELFNNHTQMVS